MSDYGLLGRKLALDVEYADTPFTLAHAKVPVFPIGREQLYEMFGLYGNNKSMPTNFVCDLEVLEDFIQDCNYVLVSFGHWADGTPSRMVTLCNAYETFEDCYYSVGRFLELDALYLFERPMGVTYDYEVWQVCDDAELWNSWMLSICVEHIQRRGFEMRERDRKQYCGMSEDYLSSLKTYNAHVLESLRQLREAGELTPDHECLVSDIVELERCAACREPLTDSYTFHVDKKPVCYDCWRRHYWFGAQIFNRERMADLDFAHAHYTDMWNSEG